MRGLLDGYRGAEPQGGLLGGYSPSPEIVDRATFLPVGQYEDGSLTLAWPGFLKDTYDAAQRTYLDAARVPVPDAPMGTPWSSNLDALTVASAPAVGSVGMKAAGLASEPAASASRVSRQTAMRLLADEPDLSLPSNAPFKGRRLAYDIANQAGDDAGRVELTLGPDGQAYIEHVVFGDTLSNGTRGARDFLRLLKAQHPEISGIFGDRVSGAHAASGNVRQSLNLNSLNANPSTASLPSLGLSGLDPSTQDILRQDGLLAP